MKRVAILHNRYRQSGGEDVVVEQEAAMLRARGHEVHTYFADNREIEESGPGLAARTIWSRRSEVGVGRFLDEHPVDIVHVHNTLPLLSPSVYSAASRRGITVVQTLHNYRLLCPAATCFRDGRVCTDCLDAPLPWPAIRHACYRDSRSASAVVASMLVVHRALRTWDRNVDAFIALTRFARDLFVAGGLPPARVHVRPNSAPDPGEAVVARRDGRGSALFLGRLSEEKGVRVLVDAWDGLSFPLEVLGDGPLRDELEARAPDTVRFLGRRPAEEVRRALERASFLVVPSIWFEGFPMVVVEAMSHGVPVVASDLGGLAEIVADGTNGRLFRPGDAGDLRRVVGELVASVGATTRLGAAARDTYLEHYTPERSYETLVEIYDRAVAARRVSARRQRLPRVSG